MGNTLAPKGVLGAPEPAGLVIEEPRVVFHEADEPDLARDLLARSGPQIDEEDDP